MHLSFTTNSVQNASRGQIYRQWPTTVNSLKGTHHVKEKQTVRALNVSMLFMDLFNSCTLGGIFSCHDTATWCVAGIQAMHSHA